MGLTYGFAVMQGERRCPFCCRNKREMVGEGDGQHEKHQWCTGVSRRTGEPSCDATPLHHRQRCRVAHLHLDSLYKALSRHLLGTQADAGDSLVIVDFYGHWCGACRALYPKVGPTAAA